MKKQLTVDQIVEKRHQYLSKNLSHYPVKIVRGKGCYMYDDNDNGYLDLINNIAHVGHANPHVVQAGIEQMKKINTNSRHLSDSLVHYAEELLGTFPKELEVLFLVNSGSEANELALRIAKCVTGQKDIIVMEHGYHGHTNAVIDISSYKFDHPKHGWKPPSFVHKVDIPDIYKGKYQVPYEKRNDERLMNEASLKYAQDIKDYIKNNNLQNKLSGFICESLLSCAGQIILPSNYLKYVYDEIRKNGGVCITDEVQSGFGRVGHHWWGFQTQNVVPDIVCIGKSMGNGHPMAGVVITREIAKKFEGLEFFSSCGASNVSNEIGLAVLQVLKNENLLLNARNMEGFIRKELEYFMNKYEIIGDIRGIGLFWGIELVKNKKTKEPATEEAAQIRKELLKRKIFISTDGPTASVLKIKPPMVIQKEDFMFFFREFDDVLSQVSQQKNHDLAKGEQPLVQNHLKVLSKL